MHFYALSVRDFWRRKGGEEFLGAGFIFKRTSGDFYTGAERSLGKRGKGKVLRASLFTVYLRKDDILENAGRPAELRRRIFRCSLFLLGGKENSSLFVPQRDGPFQNKEETRELLRK